MHTHFYLKFLEQTTQPAHPLYHPVQVIFFGSVSYIGTACLTKIPPGKGARLITLAYAISQLTTPIFIQWFEPYQTISLVPLAGQLIQMLISVLVAKFICHLLGQRLTLKEVRLISTVFIISLFAVRFAFTQINRSMIKNNLTANLNQKKYSKSTNTSHNIPSGYLSQAGTA